MSASSLDIGRNPATWLARGNRTCVDQGTTRLRYGFDWGCGIVFQYEKIHARHGYDGRIHATNIPCRIGSPNSGRIRINCWSCINPTPTNRGANTWIYCA